MTFEEAEGKLMGIANGAYRSLHYEKTITSDGSVSTRCLIYINGEGAFYSGRTWREAFQNRAEQRGITPCPVEENPIDELMEA